MGKTNTLLHSFNTGELSVAGQARVDQERTRLGADVQENIMPYAVGKGQFRPGTRYIANTYGNAQCRLIPFVKSTSDTALLEYTDSKMRVMVNDAFITRPAVTSTIANSSFAQASATITMTIATPGVVTWTSHGFSADQAVSFSTTGALPTGVTAGTIYYVISTGLTANTFRFSATVGGAAINTSGTQSGTHTGYAGWQTSGTGGATVSMASGLLTLNGFSRGGIAICKQAVATSSTGTEHGIRIDVSRGPVQFKIGSTDEGDELFRETTLDTGEHSLAFTPSASPFYVQFTSRIDRNVIVASAAIESAGIVEIAAPWTTAQLREIRYDQSADIIYLANDAWQQRKIERRTTRSWSVATYYSNDGPFAFAATNNVTMTPSAAFGNITITASDAVFRSSDVGSLLRIDSEGANSTHRLGAELQYTDAFNIFGVGADMNFNVTISGTWSGTLSLQASYDGPDAGFITSTTEIYTTNGSNSVTFPSTSAVNNIERWYRVGFEPGNYTSGVALVQFNSRGSDGYGVYRITEFTSDTQVSAEVLRAPSGLTASKDWRLSAWSERRGWPSAVKLFDGRLWWAGLDKFWGSESDNFTAFSTETDGDSGSIQRSIATGGSVATVQWMLGLQRLLIGTDASEVSVRSSSFDEPLTPTNVTLKDASTQGCAAYQPVKIDSRGIYVQRSGTRVFEIVYNFENNDYASIDVTRLNEDIAVGGIVELAVQRQPETYIWMVRADGEVPILLYNPSEKVAGFMRFIAGPSEAGVAVVESIATLPESGEDAMYLAIRRTIDGVTVRTIEKLAKHSEARGGAINHMADSFVYAAGPSTTVTAAHLLNESGLVAWATNNANKQVVLTGLSADGSGVISLGGTYTNVTVGLPYYWRYRSAKLAYGAEGGTAMLQNKRIGTVGILAADIMPRGVQIGHDFTNMYDMPIDVYQQIDQDTVQATLDELAFPFSGEWNTDSRVCMKGSAPYPCTLLGLVIGIEARDNL